MDVIDSYLHCGLSKYLPIGDVEATMAAAGVSRAVLVQHLGEYDNSYIEGIVEREPRRFAGVCLVDHRDPRAVDRLDTLLRERPFRGVRLTSEVLREAPVLFRAAAEANAVIVFFAPEGIAGSVEALEGFLDSRPHSRLVVTHLGNPEARDSPKFENHGALFRLAAYDGVYLQISGIEMFGPYPHEELYPLVSRAAEEFGSRRLLWGSNYPVVGDVEDYQKELALTLEARLPLSEESIPEVVGGNALKLWFGG